MIYACINAYNEEENIGRVVRSLAGKVDRIVVADGAYVGFNMRGCLNGQSVDGTIDVAVEAGADHVIETCNERWLDEVHKRNSYLVARPGDYYLVIDADEEFFGPELTHDILDSCRTWEIGFLRPDMPGPYPLFRLFRHDRGIHYHGTHHCLFVGDVMLNKLEHGALPEEWFIKHHVGSRSSDYYDARQAYHTILKRREQRFRAEHGL